MSSCAKIGRKLLNIFLEITHECRKPFESSGDLCRGINFYQDILFSMDVDLQKAGFIQRTIQKCEKALKKTD